VNNQGGYSGFRHADIHGSGRDPYTYPLCVRYLLLAGGRDARAFGVLRAATDYFRMNSRGLLKEVTAGILANMFFTCAPPTSL